MRENLVSGIKGQLLTEYEQLYAIHGRGWRKLLKKLNPWHDTTQGIYAWRNISNGTTGNEALRLIIADMKTIVAESRKAEILEKQGLKLDSKKRSTTSKT